MPNDHLHVLNEAMGGDHLSPASLGRCLTDMLATRTRAVQPGSEDPILAGLLAEDCAALIRRSSWNSLVLNPGSTSTKVSVYSGLKLLAQAEVDAPDAGKDGVSARVERVLGWMESQGLDPRELSGIAARGGLMAPLASGTYRICESMLADLQASRFSHASNLAAPMARAIAESIGPDVLLTTTDPVMVDEVDDEQRLTGSAQVFDDGTAAHYLNHRAVAGLCATVLGQPLADLHLITCHMGGGASAVRHEGDRAVQVAKAFGTLPSANRSGRLPLMPVIRLLSDHKYDLESLERDVTKAGGLLSLAGTDDFRTFLALSDLELSPDQAKKHSLVSRFFARRIAAELLALSASTRPIDAIVLTGGLAHAADFCDRVGERIHLGVPVARLPGGLEQPALAAGLLRASADSSSLLDYADRVAATERARAEVARVLATPLVDAKDLQAPSIAAPKRLDDLIEAARACKPVVVALVGADNPEALLAVKQAIEGQAMASFLLLGPWGPVTRMAWELDLPIDDVQVTVIDTLDPVQTSVELLDGGLADTLMKGRVGTADLLKGYLRHLKGPGKQPQKAAPHRLSHLALFDIPGRHKLVALTDAAMNTYPDVPGRIAILENALTAMRLLGYRRPKVAVLSATEKPSAAVDSSMHARQIAEAFANREDLIIEGPMSLDLALSPAAARDKGYSGAIQGDADLLLVPDIDTGNAIYKAFTVTSEADAAGAVVGGRMPVILTSRGDSARTKLAAVALSVVLTDRLKAGGK